MAKIVSKKTQEAAAPIKWSVYGCRIAEGKEGSFISFPSRKGKDGKYYSHAYFRLTQEEQDEIIQAALEGLEEEDVED